MYISDIDKASQKALKAAFKYFIISMFCALFGGVYEIFSHNVLSFGMIYAFAFPLTLGALPFFILGLKKSSFYPCITSHRLYAFGIATLTVGSVLYGVLEIYGTANKLSMLYWIVGPCFVITGVVLCIIEHISSKKKNSQT